ncbi:MAG: protein kinase [Caldilineaceae bacterium]
MAIIASSTILNGKYKILHEIGQGGMGRVWLAEELVFGNRLVALKEPRGDLPSSEMDELTRRYSQEVRVNLALQRVQAPNIVPVFTVEPFDSSSLLSMAYMPNGDLVQQLNQAGGRLPLHQALDITTAILQALRAAHEHPMEIVHRDVKPSNVLFDNENKAYLADFGLAQVSGSSSRSQPQTARLHPGTPAYMAPEQASTTVYMTPAADIYPVGCVLFEMLTGTKYKRVRPGTQPSSLQPDVPAWVDALITKATSEDPFDRYASGGDMLQAVNTGRAQGAVQGHVPNVETGKHEVTPVASQRDSVPVVEPSAAAGTESTLPTKSSPGRLGCYAAILLGFLVIAAVGAIYFAIGGLSASGAGGSGFLAGLMAGSQATPSILPPSPTAMPVIATSLQASPTSTQTNTPLPPTATPVPTKSRPTDVPTATITPQPTPMPQVTTNDIVNIRNGPGTNYDLAGSAQAGETFRITGKNPGGDWWQIDYNGLLGWIFGQLVTATNTNGVPVAQNIPDPPTPAPVPATDTPALQPTAAAQAFPTSPPSTEGDTITCWTGDDTKEIPGLPGLSVSLQEVRLQNKGFFGIHLLVRFFVQNTTANSVVWGFAADKAKAFFDNLSPTGIAPMGVDIPANIGSPYDLEASIAASELSTANCPNLIIVQNFNGQTADVRFGLR